MLHVAFGFTVHELKHFKDFSLVSGMLSATVNAANLPKTAKICPKTITLRNFEMPPKIEIFIFFKRNKNLHVVETLKHVLTLWIFRKIIFYMSFYCQKTTFACEFQHIPLRKMIFFSMFHTSCEYEILWTCT
jgi:hypothetical protein